MFGMRKRKKRAQKEENMSKNLEIAMFSINDVLDALAKIEATDGNAEDLASELTGLSIDRLWEIGEGRLPYYFVHDIAWDTDGDDADELGLPESCFVRACNVDGIADVLSDATGLCMCGFCSIPSSREDVKTHAINVLFKEGRGRDEAEKILSGTSVLEEKFITDGTILNLAKKERRPA